MRTVEIFILFPEKEDAVDRSLYLSPKSPEKSLESYIQDFQQMYSFFDHENYLGFYDSHNISRFLSYNNHEEEDYPNPKALLKKIISVFGEDWRDNPFNIGHKFTLGDLPIENDTLCEIAVRILKDKDTNRLLINNKAYENSSDSIQLFDSDQKTITFSQRPCEIPQIHEWFVRFRQPQRIYNHNPKHGENGVGNWFGATVLLCSQKDAERLLVNAIGLKNSKYLYIFDKINKKYVKFYSEGNIPQNSYHCHHLYDNEVSDCIKKKLCYITLCALCG